MLFVSVLELEQPPVWVEKALVCLLLAFPYLLLRFTAAFGVISSKFVRLAAAATVGLMVERWAYNRQTAGAWSSGLGHRPFTPGIAGSNPVAPTATE